MTVQSGKVRGETEGPGSQPAGHTSLARVWDNGRLRKIRSRCRLCCLETGCGFNGISLYFPGWQGPRVSLGAAASFPASCDELHCSALHPGESFVAMRCLHCTPANQSLDALWSGRFSVLIKIHLPPLMICKRLIQRRVSITLAAGAGRGAGVEDTAPTTLSTTLLTPLTLLSQTVSQQVCEDVEEQECTEVVDNVCREVQEEQCTTEQVRRQCSAHCAGGGVQHGERPAV